VLALLSDQELERGLVEPFGVFVQAGVREVFEDYKLGTLDACGEGLGRSASR
jgi:hypothetical protein